MRYPLLLLLLSSTATAEEEDSAVRRRAEEAQIEIDRLDLAREAERVKTEEQARRDAEARLPDRATVLSARICVRSAERRWAMGQIREERRYSKLGGVVNLGLIWRFQATVKFADAAVTNARISARAERVSLLSCSHPLMLLVAGCAGLGGQTLDRPGCEQVGDVLELVRKNDDGVYGAP